MTPEEFKKLYDCRCQQLTAWRVWFGQFETLAYVWDNCPYVDWLLEIMVQLVAPNNTALYRKLACRFIRETKLPDGRTVWDLLTDEHHRNVVITTERYVQGLATDHELEIARTLSRKHSKDRAGITASVVAEDIEKGTNPARSVAVGVLGVAGWSLYDTGRDEWCDAAWDAANAQLCAIIRSEIPNPFRSVKQPGYKRLYSFICNGARWVVGAIRDMLRPKSKHSINP